MTVLNQSKPSRGLLIAIEGCDRSGKSTQSYALKSWIATRLGKVTEDGVQYWKFPERTTPIGKIIDGYLGGKAEMPDEAIHLIFSANRWELR